MSEYQSISKSEDVKKESSESKQNEATASFEGISYDFSPGTLSLKSIQSAADDSPRSTPITQLQAMANASSYNYSGELIQLQAMADARSVNLADPIQRKENNTGLPDNLKTGMENLSGMSMDDVKVHRNSDKPAQLQAHAFAQGTDIHLGPGQEKHLPHELGHVVQQKQGRVKPTLQMKGKVNVNDDAGLEKEADVLGAKALNTKISGQQPIAKKTDSTTVQRVGPGPAVRPGTAGKPKPLIKTGADKRAHELNEAKAKKAEGGKPGKVSVISDLGETDVAVPQGETGVTSAQAETGVTAADGVESSHQDLEAELEFTKDKPLTEEQLTEEQFFAQFFEEEPIAIASDEKPEVSEDEPHSEEELLELITEKKETDDIFESIEDVFTDFVANGAENPNAAGVVSIGVKFNNHAEGEQTLQDTLNKAGGATKSEDGLADGLTGGVAERRDGDVRPSDEEGLASGDVNGITDLSDPTVAGGLSSLVMLGMTAKDAYNYSQTKVEVQKAYWKKQGVNRIKDISMQGAYVMVPQVAAAIATLRAGNELKDAAKAVTKLLELKAMINKIPQNGPTNKPNERLNKMIDFLISKNRRKEGKRTAAMVSSGAATVAASGELSGVSAGIAIFTGGSLAVYTTIQGTRKKLNLKGNARQEMAENLIKMYKTNKSDALEIMKIFGITAAQIEDPKIGLKVVLDAFKS